MSFRYWCAIFSLTLAVLGITPPVRAMEVPLPAWRTDQTQIEKCSAEAVRWAFLDQNMSDSILVNGTRKFGHMRIDGYALHWYTKIWAFVFRPSMPSSGRPVLVIGYVDPLNDRAQERNQEKISGMRQILANCLARRS